LLSFFSQQQISVDFSNRIDISHIHHNAHNLREEFASRDNLEQMTVIHPHGQGRRGR